MPRTRTLEPVQHEWQQVLEPRIQSSATKQGSLRRSRQAKQSRRKSWQAPRHQSAWPHLPHACGCGAWRSRAHIGWRIVRGETKLADVFHVFVEQNHRHGVRVRRPWSPAWALQRVKTSQHLEQKHLVAWWHILVTRCLDHTTGSTVLRSLRLAYPHLA